MRGYHRGIIASSGGTAVVDNRVWLSTADNRTLNPTNGTYGDDFEANTLDAAWTTRNLAAGDVLLPEIRTGVQLSLDVGDALLRPAPAGDFEIVTHFRYLWDQTTLASPCIIDSTGAGVAFSVYNDGNAYMWNLSGYQYSTTGPSVVGTTTRYQDHFLSLRKAGTTYTGRWATAVTGTSPATVVWSSFTAGQTWAGTVDRIGILRINPSGSKGWMEVVRFNVHVPTYTP